MTNTEQQISLHSKIKELQACIENLNFRQNREEYIKLHDELDCCRTRLLFFENNDESMFEPGFMQDPNYALHFNNLLPDDDLKPLEPPVKHAVPKGDMETDKKQVKSSGKAFTMPFSFITPSLETVEVPTDSPADIIDAHKVLNPPDTESISAAKKQRATVFISYAHKDNISEFSDQRWLDRFLQHLAPIVKQEFVEVWSDQQIQTGELWKGKIADSMAMASVAVLFISSAFLASEFIREEEMPVLLQAADERKLVILPILLSPCLVKETVFKYPDPKDGPKSISLASLQFANTTSNTITGMVRDRDHHSLDDFFVSVARRIHCISRGET